MVGLIIIDIFNMFFLEFLIGVQNMFEEVGLMVLLGMIFDFVVKQEQLILIMLEYRVGGLILCLVLGVVEEIFFCFEQFDILVVFVVREIVDVDCDFVGVDYEEGIYKVVYYFIEKGYQEIVFLGGVKYLFIWIKWMKGLKKVFCEVDFEVKNEFVIDSVLICEVGYEVVMELFCWFECLIVIFCFSDLVVFGVM